MAAAERTAHGFFPLDTGGHGRQTQAVAAPITSPATPPLPPGTQAPAPSLFRHRDFMLLWTGQSISELGSSVTTVALPLIAVVLLHASTFEVGLLSAAVTVPFLVIALPAGLVVDRVTKRWLMIGCDAIRMLAIGSVPAAGAFGALTLGQLYAVAIVGGVCTVFFDVAYQSYVPSLVSPRQLLDGNGKLGATQEVARVVGPGLGGALFGLVRSAALSADAVSYAVSTVSMLAIRTREKRSVPAGPRAGLRAELLAGLSFALGHPVLRKIMACTSTANLFFSMASAIEIVFLVRVVHVSPSYTGLLVAAGGLGGVAGGILSRPIGRRVGTARIIWVAPLVLGLPAVLIPLTEPGWRLALFPVGLAAFSMSAVLYNVSQLSFRQAICPPELLGRMNAAVRWLVWGTLPLGGLAGGVLGSAVGVRPTIWVAIAGSWLAGWWVFFSPLRTMRDIPAPG